MFMAAGPRFELTPAQAAFPLAFFGFSVVSSPGFFFLEVLQ
jgi:hypothetical protein